jgi:hypothetical protein
MRGTNKLIMEALIVIMILMGILITIFHKAFVKLMGVTRGTEYTGIRAIVLEAVSIIVGISFIVFGILWFIGVIPRN